MVNLDLSLQTIEHNNTTTYGCGSSGPGFGLAIKYGGYDWLMGFSIQYPTTMQIHWIHKQ
jgi:hypothetical protein